MVAKASPAPPIAGDQHAITLAIPHTANDVAKLQREAEADAADLDQIVVDSDVSYEAADALLTEIVTRKDAVVAMRQSVTLPLYAVTKTVEGWFRPAVAALTKIETTIKDRLGMYRLQLQAAEDAARKEAQAAAESGDAQGMIEALTEASSLAVAPVGRSSFGFRWTTAEIDVGALPAEYWCPDLEKIEGVAVEAGNSTEPPVIPGVTFKRVAKVGARR